MTEQTEQASGPTFAIQRIYVKDSSFETPNTPEIFKEQWQPEIKLDMNTRGKKLEGDMVEVILMLTVTATVSEKTAFVAEVHQAGIFQLAGFEEDQRGHMVGSYCPNLLFPYARQHLDNLVTQGSFPAVMLSPINFDAVYQQALQDAEKQKEEPSAQH